MSRIGKQPIEILDKVEVSITDRILSVKGPIGNLSFEFRHEVEVKVEGNKILVKNIGKIKNSPAIWGTTRALIQNMVEGVSKGFEKVLELHGVGYKMVVQGKKLKLNLGFSHPIEMEIPDGIEIKIDKEKMSIFGVDKQQVGQFAAEVRAFRPVEPYKGKGFRYQGEQFIKKEGKKAAGEGED